MPNIPVVDRLMDSAANNSDNNEDTTMPETHNPDVQYRESEDDEWQALDEQPDELVDPNSVYVAYSNQSCVTGRRLGAYLGSRYGRPGRMGSPRPDYLIRWGTSDGATYIPGEDYLNGMRETERNTDKYRSLEIMDTYGVPVPRYGRSLEELQEQGATYPFMGRATNHTQGRDINLILQERDDYLTDNDFYTEYIPTEHEYRVHVLDGEIVHVNQKLLQRDADNHPFIRNYETGWVFGNQRDDVNLQPAINAVEALGLDFGGVDLVKGEDGQAYVLEVNTAPSLSENNLRRWGEAFQNVLNLDPDAMGGMEAVEENHPYEEDDDANEGYAEDEDYIQV